MARVVNSARGHVVVVDRARTVATVREGSAALRVAAAAAEVGVVTRETRVAQVAAPGPQGRPGEQGPPGPAGGGAIQKIALDELSGHRIVRSVDAERVYYALAGNPLHADDVIGLTLHAAHGNDDVLVLVEGEVAEPSWSWIAGQPLYLVGTGMLSQTPPQPPEAAYSLEVGVALNPTTARIRIGVPVYFED